MKVLIVDDSRTTRRIMASSLRKFEVETIEAEHGVAALEVLAKNPGIQLVFMDWIMPVMSGIECLQQIRKNEAYNSIRVCMVTSVGEQDNISEALSYGATEYLIKPFTPEALYEKLQLSAGAL